jgi:hypothetical protein
MTENIIATIYKKADRQIQVIHGETGKWFQISAADYSKKDDPSLIRKLTDIIEQEFRVERDNLLLLRETDGKRLEDFQNLPDFLETVIP